MSEMITTFVEDGSAYHPHLGVIHIGLSPFAMAAECDLVGRRVVLDGQLRTIVWFEQSDDYVDLVLSEAEGTSITAGWLPPR